MSEMKKLGGIWKSKSKAGETYLSGIMRNDEYCEEALAIIQRLIDGYDIKVLLFPNKKKEKGDKKPDINIFVAEVDERPRERKASPPQEEDLPY